MESGYFSNNRAVDLHKILAYLMGRRPAQILALNRGYSRAVDLSPYLKVFTVGTLPTKIVPGVQALAATK